MNSERPLNVSVIDPITPAIDRVKLMLFKPFDFEKWFTIGFCAWLALLGSGGGMPSFNSNFGRQRRYPHFHEFVNDAKEFTLNNLAWIVPVAVFVVLISVAIGLVIAWLSSRGRFMFLHCVAGNKSEVKIPWAKYKDLSYSLFLFRVVIGLSGFVVVAVPAIYIVVMFFIMASAGVPKVGAIVGMIFLGFCIVVISICLGLISKFTTDFVVPVMFLRTIKIREAWREFLKILSVNKARFLLYILFQIVINLTIGMIILVLCCVTCCCACCFFALPYIGTVVLLPVHIFKMAYSLFYLKQFGPQLDVFNIENLQPALPENPY